MIYDGIPLTSSDSVMISKEKKNRRATVKIQIKIYFLSLKAEDDTLFKNREKICLCTKAIKGRAKNCIG